MKRLLRHIRLIPAVLVLGAVLLGLKGAGLIVDARAQDQPAPSAEEQRAPSVDPAADDADASSAQIDVLTSLAKRRAMLDARERDLDMRENLIAAAELRVEGKITDLKQLETQIEGLLVQRDDAEQKQLAGLVKTYSNMAPKDAARIFDGLNEEVLVAVAQQMKPADLAAVLGKMESEPAQKLTVKLANRLKIPNLPVASPAPVAAAAATPAPAAPQSITPAEANGAAEPDTSKASAPPASAAK